MGFAEAAATVQDLYLARRHRDAMAAVPYEFIDSTSLLGPRERLAEQAGRVGRGRGDDLRGAPSATRWRRSSAP